MKAVVLSLLLALPSTITAAARAQSDEPPAASPRSASPYELEANRRTDAANELLAEGDAADAVRALRALVDEHLAHLGRAHAVTAQGYNNLAHALAVQGDYAEAVEMGHEALAILQELDSDGPELALVKRNLADVCERQGELQEAQVWIEDCWRLLEGGFGKTPMVAEARERAARIALQLGQLDLAQEHLEWAFAIYERLLPPDDPTAARTLIPLATVLARQGQFDMARILYGHARRLLERASTPSDEDWSIAFDSELALLNRLGEKSAARDLLADLIERRPACAELTADGVEIELQIAANLLEAGAPQRARRGLERVREHLAGAASEDPFALVRALLPLARAHLELGDAAAALATVDEALKLMESGPGLENEVAVELLVLRGTARLHAWDLAGAKEDLHAVLDIRRDVLGARHPALLDVFLGLIECELGTNGVTVGLVDLLDMVEGPLSHATPARLTDRIHSERQAFGRSYDAALVRANYAQALAKRDTLPAAFAAIDRQRERALLAALGWWIESGQLQADDRLASLVTNLDLRAGQVFEKALEVTLDDQTAQLQQEVRANGRSLSRVAIPKSADLETARAFLGESRLLQYSWAGSELWGMCLGRASEDDRVVLLGTTDEVAPLLRRAQADLRDPSSACDLSALARLLLEPFADQLAGCDDVVVVADGPLAFLPFEALPFGEGGPWVTRARIAYAPSVAALMEPAGPRAVGEGVAHFGPARLPAASEAPRAGRVDARFARDPGDGPAPTIGEVLPEGELQVAGAAARESVLKAKSAAGELAGLRLLDLNVKTYVDASVPSATGLRLAPETDDQERPLWRRENGFVHLGELGELELGTSLALLPLAEVGPDPLAADLRSEGLHGLVRSLWAAGARGVILAGWTTPDNAARLFDARLAGHVAADAPRAALCNAQRAWLRDAEARGPDGASLRHPAVWARLRYFGR